MTVPSSSSPTSSSAAVPRPESITLTGPSRPWPNVKPPFGVERWTDGAAAATAVLVELERGEQDAAATTEVVARQTPAAADFRSGSLVVLLGVGVSPGGFLPGLFGPRKVAVSRVSRATALLARGYTRIAAGEDPASRQDLVWGYTP